MGETPEATIPLHPVVLEIGKLITFPDPNDGSKAIIPPTELYSWTKRLKREREDKLLFMHLAVLAFRLQSKGLVGVGESLVTLAKIGLNDTELEQTMKGMDQVRGAAAAVKSTGPALAGTGGMPAGGGKSVGLRGGGKKSPAPTPKPGR